MKNLIFIAILLIFGNGIYSQSKTVPYTLEDRDRLIRLEEKLISTDNKINSLRTEMNAKFEVVNERFKGVNQRFDDLSKSIEQLFNFLWAIVGIFTAIMVATLSLAFWDRRTFLKPLKDENKKVVNVLKEYAKERPDLKIMLRNAGIF